MTDGWDYLILGAIIIARSMQVVRLHKHVFVQPVEPLSGTGNIPVSREDLLRRVIDCTERSSVIATPDIIDTLISLQEGMYFKANIKTPDSATREELISQFKARKIDYRLCDDSETGLQAYIHLPEFLKLCRNINVEKIERSAS